MTINDIEWATYLDGYTEAYVLAPNILSLRRFLLLFGLGAILWALLLRFFFPGYFDPFVPYHADHYIYLGNSAEPYGLSRYITHYPRPLGNTLFDLLGRLGIRGLLAPIFLLVLANVCLLIRYVERVSHHRTSWLIVAVFFLLVFGNPESYSSTKEDILASVCFFCLLVIFHLWQNYLTSGKVVNLLVITLLAFLSSYVKETYFATIVLFFVIQAVLNGKARRTAIILAIVNAAIAAASLAYNAHIPVFINLHADKAGPYYQDRSLASILHSYRVLLKWLLLPIPTLLVAAALVALAVKMRRCFYIALISLALAVSVLLPHSILPNHLEDQYAWLAAGFFFVPLLLADQVLPKTRTGLFVSALAAIVLCTWSLREYRKDLAGRAGWLREQEAYQRNFLTAWQALKYATHDGEHELVVGLQSTFSPFSAPSFILKSFGPRRNWTVVVPDDRLKGTTYTTETIHTADLKPTSYDHVFVFSPDDHLEAIYSKNTIDALISCGKWSTLIPDRDHATAH